MEKYICIHGHFYQPPRENPWLEAIEVQDSAYPYRDWNERISAECYHPNMNARILQNNSTVIDIVNNYSKISFNFGPTLLSWLETNAPEVYSGILAADKESIKNFSGHGSAIAQVYNHTIMPLNNTRDKETQVIWGIEDFVSRFRRRPEGMWLAETAVDIETLEILAKHEIKFTILAPRQAHKVKPPKAKQWTDVGDSRIDPKRPYLCKLPSGKRITLFFYDGPVSQDLAFGELLKNGESMANRLIETFDDKDESAQLVHVATDGETYGHHQKQGEMALAYCLSYLESNNLAKITVYGEYLERFPPEWEVKIFENTSWSCVHGIERWRSSCGCSAGHPDWNQEWREPLRQSMDWLRDSAAAVYEKEMAKFSGDPWGARNNYVKVILDRNGDNITRFLKDNGIKSSNEKDLVAILKLLEMQRHTMLMYTSCGWFFDEISGIETVQVILYAARVIQLVRELTGSDLEPEYIRRLEKIISNIPNIGNGAFVYENYIKPAVIDLMRVAAHYAVSALFKDYSAESKIFCYEIFSEDYEKLTAGKVSLAIGRSRMRSQITHEAQLITHSFFHLGDHNLNGGVRESRSPEQYTKMKNELRRAFRKLNVSEIILLIDKHYGTHSYSLWHLFKDESRKVFNMLMRETLDAIEINYRQLYQNHYPMMLAMLDTGTPLPKALTTAIEFIINTDFRKMLESPDLINVEELQNLSREAVKWNVELDKKLLGYFATKRISVLMQKFTEEQDNFRLLNELNILLTVLKELGLELDLSNAQNILFYYMRDNAINIEGRNEQWLSGFSELEKLLTISLHESV